MFWVSLWQTKEYRMDRITAHFRETDKGKSLFLSWFLLIKWLLILGYFVAAFNETLFFPYQLAVTAVFVVEGYRVINEILSHRIRRPVLTPKAIILAAITIAVIGGLYFIPFFEKFVWLLMLDRLLITVMAVAVSFFAYPTEFMQDIRIEQAMKKINKYISLPDDKERLLVIGISGSYGKSSTKEYIAQLLSQKFSVLKTFGSHNTPIGIANTILSGLRHQTEVFVVELGSYKKGEITQLCQIVKPRISVTTSISDQHLSLFGSFENIMETENELISALPKDGLALFNANNDGSKMLYRQTKKKKILYESLENAKTSMSAKRRSNAQIVAFNIVPQKTSVVFDVLVGKKAVRFEAPLLGAHSVENILPAIYLANLLGMKMIEIKQAVAKLAPLEKRMVLHHLGKGGIAIDDTFNASPESVLSAISYMKLYKGKKILVLEPMIELGKNADEDHYNLAKQIAKICDYLFLTNKNYYKAIASGIQDGDGECMIEIESPAKIAEDINNMVGKDDVIVFEGREAGLVLNKIV